jgi:hypothetical protein
MAHDWYSKAVLTVIAGALVMLVVAQNLARTLCDRLHPCHISISDDTVGISTNPRYPLDVPIVKGD